MKLVENLIKKNGKYTVDNLNILLILTLFLASSLRIFHLDFYDFWNDEILQYTYSKSVTLFQTASTVQTPLRPIILKLTDKFFGSSEFLLRLPSAIISIFSVLLLYLLAKKMFDKKIGVISAFLLTISYYAVERAQEAKHYPFMNFFTLLSSYFLFSIIQEGVKVRKLLLLFLSLFLIFYSGFMGLFSDVIIISYFLFFLIIKYFKTKKITWYSLKKNSLFFPALILAFGFFVVFLSRTTILRLLDGVSVQLVDLESIRNLSFLNRATAIIRVFSNESLNLYLPIFCVAIISSLANIRKKFFSWTFLYFWILSFTIFHLFFNLYFKSTDRHTPDNPQYYFFFMPFYLITISLGITALAKIPLRYRPIPGVKKEYLENIIVVIFILLLSINPIKILWNYYFVPIPWRAEWKSSASYLVLNARKGDNLVRIFQPEIDVNLINYYFDYQKYGLEYSIFPREDKEVNWYVSISQVFPFFEDWAVSDIVHPSRKAYPSWVFQLSYLGKGKKAEKISDRSGWKLNSNNSIEELPDILDGDINTPWQTKRPLEKGDFFQVDMGKERNVVGIELNSPLSSAYPKDFLVETSLDGISWNIVQSAHHSNDAFYLYLPVTPFKPTPARFIKVKNLLRDKLYWQIDDVQIYEVVDQNIPNRYEKDSPFTGLVVKDQEAKGGFAKFVPKCTPAELRLLQYGERFNLPKGLYRANFRIKTDNNRGDKTFLYGFTDLAIEVGFEKDAEIRPKPLKINPSDFKQKNQYQTFHLDFKHDGDIPIVLLIKVNGENNYWFEYPEIKRLK